IGPDPRNFNQRVSLGRNDLLIRTFPKKDALMTALMNRIGVDSERPLKSLLELVGMNEQKLKSYSESQLHRALSKELEANMPDIDPKTLARWLKDEGAR
ncbi:hypothetical protein PCJ24_18000, partial [Klebsiella pneumoniae]|nr:hypothetical protein [Klebsiella pneumoniae]